MPGCSSLCEPWLYKQNDVERFLYLQDVGTCVQQDAKHGTYSVKQFYDFAQDGLNADDKDLFVQADRDALRAGEMLTKSVIKVCLLMDKIKQGMGALARGARSSEAARKLIKNLFRHAYAASRAKSAAKWSATQVDLWSWESLESICDEIQNAVSEAAPTVLASWQDGRHEESCKG